MATDLRSLPAYLSTDSLFRSWGSGIAAQLAACGMVQHTDTGQINWSTVTLPSTSTYGGYEIWRFNDPMQATWPLFVKIEYGIASSATRPAIRTRIGTGTDGAGTLTGQFTTTLAVNGGASKSGTGDTLPSYCCVLEGGLYLWNNLDNASTNYGIGLAVERSLLANGTATADGAFMLGLASGSANVYLLASSGTNPGSPFNPVAAFGSSSAQTNSGTNRAVAPAFTWAINGKCWLPRLMQYLHTDIGELSSISATWRGCSTFMPMGDGAYLASSTTPVMSPWE